MKTTGQENLSDMQYFVLSIDNCLILSFFAVQLLKKILVFTDDHY